MKMRLDRFVARASLGSRKEASKLIKEGKIKVNEKIIKDPSFKIDLRSDKIFLEDKPLILQENFYYKYYKPTGVITSKRDKEKTIFDLLPETLPGFHELSPAGRLDKDAEGLILLTNDGELIHRITHPKWKLPKTYEVEIDRPLTEEDKKLIEGGIELKEGKTRQAQIKILNPEKTYLEITVTEGRYHLLKRLFGKLNYKVLKIKRVSIGPLRLEPLRVGEVLPLTKEEIESLKSSLGLGKG